MYLELVKLILASVLVDGTLDVESFNEIILFIPFQVFFKSLISFWKKDFQIMFFQLDIFCKKFIFNWNWLL